jgi:hypothetical protein
MAERSARGTTVYLVPGLTGGQRRAVLRRLRQEASRGCGPALPGADLTVALAADRFRVGLRNTASVIRLHPAGSLLPAAFAGLLMTLFVLASVSARMTGLPQAPVPGGPSPGGAPTVVGVPVLAHASGRPGGPPAPRAHPAKAGSNSQTTLVTSSSPGTGPVKHHKHKHPRHGVVIRLCGLGHITGPGPRACQQRRNLSLPGDGLGRTRPSDLARET